VQDYADEFASFPTFLDPLSSIPLIWNLFSNIPPLLFVGVFLSLLSHPRKNHRVEFMLEGPVEEPG
jgi:hypothetical protein